MPFSCLLCVSLPAAFAASADEGLSEGRLKFSSAPTNANVEKFMYTGSQYFLEEATQIGIFTDDSSFCPTAVTSAFTATAAGSLGISVPMFEITVPVSGGPVRTSDSNRVFIAYDVREIIDGVGTTTRYEVDTSYTTSVDGSYRTYTTSYRNVRFSVKAGGRYTVTLVPLFEFNANSEVGSTLLIKSLDPIFFSTSGTDLRLKPYIPNIPPFVSEDVSFHAVTVTADEGCTVTPFRGYGFPVEDGVTYYFTVDIAEGYRKTDNFSVKVNGSKPTLFTSGAYKGAYQVNKPAGEQIIEVTGVERAAYNVTLSDAVEGCQIHPFYGADKTGLPENR